MHYFSKALIRNSLKSGNATALSFKLFGLSLLVGVCSAVATQALIMSIMWVQRWLFGVGEPAYFTSFVAGLSAWSVFIIPTLGGLVVGIFIRYLPGKRYHGIADVTEACAIRGGHLDARSGLGVFAITAISLGSGTSLGREGPAVHISASLASGLCDFFSLAQSHRLTLIGGAAAAAVTASFNAPVAGVLFALEVIVGFYAMRIFAPIVVSTLGAVLVVRLFNEDQPIFLIPETYVLANSLELLLFGVIGLISGLVVALMVGMVQRIRSAYVRYAVPMWVGPCVAGMITGIVAIFFPEVLGVGYQTTDMVLNESPLNSPLLLVLLAKILVTVVAMGSGSAGGVFSPSILMGALLGAVIGEVGVMVFPGPFSSQGVYAIVGMAAVASAMLGAPISTLLIVFELTIHHQVVVGIMLAVAMASTVMLSMPYHSFFRWQLQQRGVNITTGRDQALLRSATVAGLASEKMISSDQNSLAVEVIQQLALSRERIVVALDEHERYVGVISLDELHFFQAEEMDNSMTPTVLKAVLHRADYYVLESTSLQGTLDMMVSEGLEYIPVLSVQGSDQRSVVGIVWHDEILVAYNKMLRQARAEEYGIN